MKAVIDRFEGNTAVLEVSGQGPLECDRRLLPRTAKEGDVLEITITTDSGARADRERQARDLQEKLKKKN